MRILVLQVLAQWTGAVESKQAYLKIPPTLDMAEEEKNWFAGGGGSLRDFVNYLKKRGAKELLNVEEWPIRYS